MCRTEKEAFFNKQGNWVGIIAAICLKRKYITSNKEIQISKAEEHQNPYNVSETTRKAYCFASTCTIKLKRKTCSKNNEVAFW